MQMVKISDLHPHPRNKEFFDDITGDKWEDFKKSIVRRGVVECIVVDQDLTIVSGHQRVRACKELGILEIPCRITHYPDTDPQTGTNKEDMILEDLISTNILQRGIGNINPMKMNKCIRELERIYGIRQGSISDGSNQYIKRADQNNFGHQKSQIDLAKELNISDQQLRNYKQLTNLIPELQSLVEHDSLKATTAYKIWAKMPQEEQEKFFNEIGKEKIKKLTQKETERLIQEKQQLETENKDLSEKVKEAEELQGKIKEMETELQNRPVVETEKKIEKEVIPSDYEDTKRKLKNSNMDYQSLRKEYDKRVSELNKLKEEIKAMQSVTEEAKYAKKLKDGALCFCNKINDFIQDTGGFVWLSEHINELPDFERNGYIKAIDMVENWAFAMKANMKKYL